MAHSVLTEDLIDEPGQPTRDALEQVLDFLDERLGAPERCHRRSGDPAPGQPEAVGAPG